MAQKPRGMHPEDIKAFICKTWGTLAAFSVAKGRAPAAASNAIRQPSYSHPMAQIIAKEMGKQPYDVWPDFYHPDGTPVPCRIGRTSTAASGAAHRQNGVAA